LEILKITLYMTVSLSKYTVLGINNYLDQKGFEIVAARRQYLECTEVFLVAYTF
jgi:hypothetical protein